MKTNISLLILLLSLTSNIELFAQLDMEKSELDVDPIDQNIYLLIQKTNISNPSSILYVDSNFSLLIDPGFKQMQFDINAVIASLDGAPIEYLMATHFHTDHAQALEDYYNKANILLSSYQYPGAKEIQLSKVFATSGKSYHLNLGNEELEVISLPQANGHTGTDAVFHFKNSDVLVIGDYLFYGMFPIIDIKGGGSIEGYIKNLEHIHSITSPKTKIIPGHTSFKPEVTKNYYSADELLRHISDLKETIDWITTRKKQEIELTSLIEQGLPDKFQKYTEGMKFVSEQKWITFIYENNDL